MQQKYKKMQIQNGVSFYGAESGRQLEGVCKRVNFIDSVLYLRYYYGSIGCNFLYVPLCVKYCRMYFLKYVITRNFCKKKIPRFVSDLVYQTLLKWGPGICLLGDPDTTDLSKGKANPVDMAPFILYYTFHVISDIYSSVPQFFCLHAS